MNNISIQQILVPFRLGYEIWIAHNISTERSEKFVDTNNVSIQQISCSVPFNKEAWTNNISIQQIYRTAIYSIRVFSYEQPNNFNK